MIARLRNWLTAKTSKGESTSADQFTGSGRNAVAGQTAKRPSPRPAPSARSNKPATSRRADERQSSKNTATRNQYVREQTGTNETLKIFDHSLPEPEDDIAFDPYNTGGFDRSKNWKNHS
jgi:hypothetical protein